MAKTFSDNMGDYLDRRYTDIEKKEPLLKRLATFLDNLKEHILAFFRPTQIHHKETSNGVAIIQADPSPFQNMITAIKEHFKTIINKEEEEKSRPAQDEDIDPAIIQEVIAKAKK